MATSREYLAWAVEQLDGLDVCTRPMMGEYLLYYRERLVGGVYDNCLLLKDVPAARACLPEAELISPYEGAKPMLAADCLEDPEKMRAVLEAMYPQLPELKRRK